MVIKKEEKKRNNCKKHLPYKVGHAKKKKNVLSSEIMVLSIREIQEKVFLLVYLLLEKW